MEGRLIRVVWAGVGVALIGLAWGAGPPADRPASPRSLPTDGLPPFGMLDDNGILIPVPSVIPPRPTGAPSTVVATHPVIASGLSLDLATQAVRATVDACAREGYLIAAAVIDSAGKPRATLMAEGSDGSIFVAMRKAVTALTYRMPSSEVSARLPRDEALLKRMTPVMFIAGGGLPISRGGEIIGAIGSSGAHGQGPIGRQDELCAQAGLASIQAQLGRPTPGD
jgi:uncharacterized protein GlcG (DUF336 family)